MTSAVEHTVSCGETDCGASMTLTTYTPPPGKGKPRPFYRCSRRGCPGTHGAHPDGRPLGRPADQPTKQARIKLHAWFDALWKGPERIFHARPRAYAWLRGWMAERYGYAPEEAEQEAHIAMMDEARCDTVIAAIIALRVRHAEGPTPLEKLQDEVRAAIATRFGRRRGREGREWLGSALGRPGAALVHDLDEATCQRALELLRAPTPVS